MNLSSNLIGNSNIETNFPYELLLTNTQLSNICKAFANGLSASIKFSKFHIYKIVQLRGFLFGLSDMLGPPILPSMDSILNTISSPFEKEPKNADLLKEIAFFEMNDLILSMKKFNNEFHQFLVQQYL